MSNEFSEINLKAIGVVKNEMKETGVRPNIRDIVSEIELYDSYADGLDRLDEYSHIIVLYHYHMGSNQAPKPIRQHAHNKESYPVVGIFALRGSNRPNRIGLSMAKILKVGSNKVKVSGLDAIDGTPVIDIKPYIPRSDSIPDAQVSPWQMEWQKQS